MTSEGSSNCEVEPSGYGTLARMSESASARPGRNDLCSCGSGLKYKRCCLPKDEAAAAAARVSAAGTTATEVIEAAPVASKRPSTPPTHQPWKATAARSFFKPPRMPRKVGGA
jgi:hypothetical protein